jgi:predicted nucleic acid-binding protein
MKVLDTYALVAMVQADDAYAAYVREDFFIPDTTLAEFSWVLKRDFPELTKEVWLAQLANYCQPVDQGLLMNAMDFKWTHRKQDVSFFDAVGYVAALRERCPFVTGDDAFRSLPNVEFVKASKRRKENA